MAGKYPTNDETVRPYRLYDANEKSFMLYRYYSDVHRAHIGALVESRWAKVGVVIEVIDISVGKMVGQYKRKLHTVDFIK